jgi:hypothetical protein
VPSKTGEPSKAVLPIVRFQACGSGRILEPVHASTEERFRLKNFKIIDTLSFRVITSENSGLQGAGIPVMVPALITNEQMNEYQWEDDLGPLPAAPVRVNFDGNDCWLEQLNHNGEWFKVARRENRQWTSLFSNLRIEQETPRDPIEMVQV